MNRSQDMQKIANSIIPRGVIKTIPGWRAADRKTKKEAGRKGGPKMDRKTKEETGWRSLDRMTKMEAGQEADPKTDRKTKKAHDRSCRSDNLPP